MNDILVSGAISDASTSKFRRRAWIIGSTAVISIGKCMWNRFDTLLTRASVSLTLAFALQISAFLVDTFGGGAGDWDPVRNEKVSEFTIPSTVCIFVLPTSD